MLKVTVDANSETEAIEVCGKEYGFTPDAVREVDSGSEDTKAFMCFESAQDAEIWDAQV